MATKQKAAKPRSKRRRPPPFTGILAKPMEPPRPPHEQEPDEDALTLWLRQHEGYLYAEKTKRIDALLERYAIREEERSRESVLRDLVLALVEDFDIPGFRVVADKPKVGRPKTWNTGARLKLLHAIEVAKSRRRRFTALSACMRLVAVGQPYSGYKGDSLYRTYQKVKKESPVLVRWAKLVQQGRSDEIQEAGFHPTVKVSG